MKPSHTAFVVKSAREGTNERAQWREIGGVWPHKNGGGFDLVIADQLSVSGRIVCVRKERDNGGDAE